MSLTWRLPAWTAGLKASQTNQSSGRKHLSTMITMSEPAKRGERKVTAPWGPCQSFPSSYSGTYSWNSLLSGVREESIFDIWALVQDYSAARIVFKLRWQLQFCLGISKYFMTKKTEQKPVPSLILLTVDWWIPYWSQVLLNQPMGKAVRENSKTLPVSDIWTINNINDTKIYILITYNSSIVWIAESPFARLALVTLIYWDPK